MVLSQTIALAVAAMIPVLSRGDALWLGLAAIAAWLAAFGRDDSEPDGPGEEPARAP